ncbi:hypothetical protein SAMN04488078_101093 [Antarctobacter heliothermus]|uniref:Uncharacterized protein n=2 Tax=Antarctobacter heliothermus TaxID=74033 RepID=A0A239DF31_9RHOB|nr:hypothetical protein SAMN04488078_101093 [Antarctobacter heliothermus]
MIERIESAAGTARVEMQADGSGHYRYVLPVWIAAAPEDEGALGDGVWMIEEVSGLYGWRGPCLNDAKRALRLQDAPGVES